METAVGTLGLLMAPSVLRLGQRQARETGTATPACRELPYPAPSLQPMSRALGERRGAERAAQLSRFTA